MAQASSYVPAFLSNFLTRTLMAAVPQAEKEMAGYFVTFTDKLIDAVKDGKFAQVTSKNAAKDIIMEIWKSVSSSLAENIQAGIDKAIVKKLNEETKTKHKLESLKLPTCGRRSGPNSKNPNQPCGKPCVDKTVYKDKDGNEYCLCKKHTKAADSKHSCEWVYGDEAPKKKATKCGCRVKSETVYNTPGSWKGVTYAGLWICNIHTKKANENLEKNNHKCKFSGTKGDRECDKLQKHIKDKKTGVFTWLSDMCAKHSKKPEKKTQKKDTDQRKQLKAGKGKSGKKDKKDEKAEKKAEKKKVEESESESESESEDESDNEKDEDKKEEVKEEKTEKREVKEDKKEEKKDRRPTIPLEVTEGKKPEEEKKSKPSIEKLIVKENFTAKGHSDPDWKLHKIKDDDNEDMNIFVDITSGLAIYNEEDMESETLDEDQFENMIVYGVWDSESQSVVELSKQAKAYAKKLGLNV